MFPVFEKYCAATIVASAFIVTGLAVGGGDAAARPDTSNNHGSHVAGTISGSRIGTVKPVSMTKFRIILQGSQATSDNEWRYVPVRRMAVFNASKNPGSKAPAGKLTEGVYCKDGNSQPCWCEGARTCRKFRATCVKLGARVKCDGKNGPRRPTHCACSK